MTSIPGGEVSASKFSTAFGRAGCGMKFYYRYVEGIKGAVSASLLAGIAFDEATRQLHDNRIAGSIVADPTEVFVNAWENPNETNRDGEAIDYDLSDAPDDILGRGENALSMYAASTEGMKPIATQVYVERSFEETDAKLIGYIDLIEAADTGICVSDVKSSLSSRKKWTEQDAARDAQLGIYSILADGDVTAVGWRHARLGGKIEVGATHVAAPNQQTVLHRIAGWMSDLERWCETGSFAPTGLDKDAWVCSAKYCDYYNRCPHGAAAQTVIPMTIGGNK
jgi:hypothetical protein